MDFSDVSWRGFFDQRRGSNFSSRMAEKLAHVDGLSFKHLGKDRWSYNGDEFEAQDAPRELVFAYAVYRDKVLDDGGTPSEFERPTKDGWE